MTTNIVMAFPLSQQTYLGQIQGNVDDITRNFWNGQAVPPGFPIENYQAYGENSYTIWSMSTVIDIQYEWWLTSGSTDAANRISAEWKWLQNSYNPTNIQGCGATRTGSSPSVGYYFQTSTAQDDGSWNVKTLLQIYNVTKDALALTYASGLQACTKSEWTAANGGLYYNDSQTTKQIYQVQYALDAFALWQISGTASYLTDAENDITFINTYMLYQNNLYAHTVTALNVLSPNTNPSPTIPGSSICFLGNVGMSLFAARDYSRTGLSSWLAQITNTVTAMISLETLTSQSGTLVWMNDCDAFTNATEVVAFAREVIPVLPPSLQSQVKTIFQNTANSIRANDRDNTIGLYGGNWEGPLVGSWASVGNGSVDTNVAVSTQAVLMLIANYVANGT